MSDVAVGDPFYRFDATSYVDGSVEVHMARYYMVRETPKGWWLSHWMNSDVWHVWVSKTARKRYAYPTPEEPWKVSGHASVRRSDTLRRC